MPMTTAVPLHRARAALSALIAACEREPITLTRNGTPVAVLAHPSVVEVEDETMLTPSARRVIRADLLHALAVIESIGHCDV